MLLSLAQHRDMVLFLSERLQYRLDRRILHVVNYLLGQT